MLRDPLSSQYDIVRLPLYGEEVDAPGSFAMPAVLGRARPPGLPSGPFEIDFASSQAHGLTGYFPMLAGQGGMFRELVAGAHGTLVGSSAPTMTDFGPAIDMTTGGSYVTASNSELSLEPGTNFTWLIWVDIRGSGTRGLLLKGQNASGERTLQLQTDGTVRVLIIGSDSFDSTQTPTGITLIGVTNQDKDMQLFINGVYENGTTTFLSPPDTTAYPFYIGTDLVNTCDSVIHEVRLYNRILSANEQWSAYDQATRWELRKPIERFYIGWSEAETSFAVPNINLGVRPPSPLAGSVEINLDSKQAEGLLLAANFESGNFSGVWDGGTKPWTAGTRSFELSEYGYGCYSDGSAALDLIAPVRSIESMPDSGTLVVRLKLTNRSTVGAQREVAGVYGTTQDRALLCQNAYAAGYGMALELRTTDGYSSVLVTEEAASVYQLNTEYVYGLTWLYDGSTGYDMRLVRFGADGLYTNSAFGTLNKIAEAGKKVGFFGTDVIAGFVYETRLYEQVISDDMIYSAYDQSSRRELYKSVERFFTGWSEAEMLAAGLLRRGAWRGVSRGIFRGA